MSGSLATHNVPPEWLLRRLAGLNLSAGYQLSAAVRSRLAPLIAAETYRVPGRAAAAATVRPDGGR